MTTPRAVIFARVSKIEQAAPGEISIDEQLRIGTEAATANGWTLVGELVAAGVSADVYNWDEFMRLAESKRPPITAPRQLIEMIDRRAFDILITRRLDRAGRDVAIMMEIFSRCHDAQISVYETATGEMLRGESGFFQAFIKGMASGQEIKEKVRRTEEGTRKRVLNGLAPRGRLPMTHLRFYDPDGTERIIVNEELRPLWEAIWVGVVEAKVGWHALETWLAERGFVSASGRPYAAYTFMNLFKTPYPYGVTAAGTAANGRKRVMTSDWTFNPAADLAALGITASYGKIPALWAGDKMLRFIAEYQRRQTIIGRRQPATNNAFSGLLVCSGCNYTMSYNHRTGRGQQPSYNCAGHRVKNLDCPSLPHTVWLDDVYAQADTLLRDLIASELDDWPVRGINKAAALDDVAAYTREIEKLDNRLAILTDELGSISDARQRAKIRANMDAASARIDYLEAERAKAQTKLPPLRLITQPPALATIRANGLAWLWRQDVAEQNAFLFQLLGNLRLAIWNAEIVGLCPYPHKQNRARERKT